MKVMNDYIETRIDLTPCSEMDTDLLADALCELGYESFVPDENGLTAYIKNELADERVVAEAIEEYAGDRIAASITHTFVEGQDWNSEWEKNYFQPIVVGDECVIHSSFHTDFPQCRYDIVIDPKMAFGTGHHATTSLIISQLLGENLDGKAVIDMGTGTGILAILAAMRGAKPVTAVEIDPVAYANAVENVALNGHPEIAVILGDAAALKSIAPAQLFIANINRNVILGDLNAYSAALQPGGTMLLSGFYEEDAEMITQAAGAYGLQPAGMTTKDRWTCLRLRKQE